MNQVHYALHPGNCIDDGTGEARFIGLAELAGLYGLSQGEYMVWDDILSVKVLRTLTGERIIHLYPRSDGLYFKVPHSIEDQLDLWVQGISLHMIGKGGGVCCPDFSCCIDRDEPVPLEVRERFIQARKEMDSPAISSFLSMFLSIAMVTENPGGGVTVAGDKNAKIN